MKIKKAFITGVTGQDGSFLAEFLLKKGYHVAGFIRERNLKDSGKMEDLSRNLNLYYGDISHGSSLELALRDFMPDEIYHLASQSRPSESWVFPEETLIFNGMAAVRLFEAARNNCPKAKIYNASSSEIFGFTNEPMQDEFSKFNPANPYAAAKAYAHQMANIYRNSYGMFISNGILFNHESERRPLHFVTQKIAYGAACAFLNIKNSPDLNEFGKPLVSNGFLALGNLEVSKDWGYAEDFIRAMWLMLQQENASDFVIGTGELHSLKELCEIAYNYVGLNWEDFINFDSKLARPIETNKICANSSKALEVLGWSPSVAFDQMIHKMVNFQIEKLKNKVE